VLVLLLRALRAAHALTQRTLKAVLAIAPPRGAVTVT